MAVASIMRTELYRRVWSEPMRRLSKAFGLSDVGMAKICRKHNIPRPPRGYWAKKQVGKAPPQIPLPNPHIDCSIPMRDPSEFRTSPLQDSCDTARAGTNGQEQFRIEVGETIRGAHELVSQAREELQKAEKDHTGLLILPQDAALHIRVSEGCLRRSLLIMNALLKALEERGYSITRGPKVRILEIDVGFGITEPLKTIRKEAADEDFTGSYRFGHSRFEKIRSPSGRLTLQIDNAAYSWSRTAWQTIRDGKKPLEERLNSVLAGLEEMAAYAKQRRIEQEREEQERREAEERRQEEAKRRADLRARAKEEQARVDDLNEEAKDWNQSRIHRRYIEAAQQNYLSNHGAIEPGSEMAQWLQWASQQADRLDPLRSSPPSILDEDLGNDEDEKSRRYW